MRAGENPTRAGVSWWPYILPYFAFLVVVELFAHLPAGFYLMGLVLKPIIPAALLVWFFFHGEYPELRGARFHLVPTLGDVAVGIGSAALWVVPYLLFASLRPDPADAFNPEFAGPELLIWVMALRAVGYAVVTPVFEELFIRSFVMRYSEVFADQGEFRDVPIAHYSLRSFLATVVVFTITHVPWEYWVAVPWIALTNIWFYWRKSLWGIILVHATANASIFLLATFGASWFRDASGNPVSLWFFL